MFITKIKGLLSSIRFWIVTLTAASGFLSMVADGGFSWVQLFDTMKLWLGAVAAIGTLDSIAVKAGTAIANSKK